MTQHPTSLLELAAKVEAATEPSAHLDNAIRLATNAGCAFGDYPRYTASLDAAMSLVPEGWRMAALCERAPWFARLETLDFDSVTWGKGGDWITTINAGQETTAKAATPALALAAAALRARQS